MNCRELSEFLDAWLDRTLEPAAAREFQRHLAMCPMCVAYLESYERTIEAARRAHEPGRNADMPEELVQAILAARRRH
jgi:anti-sigma factor RsiW